MEDFTKTKGFEDTSLNPNCNLPTTNCLSATVNISWPNGATWIALLKTYMTLFKLKDCWQNVCSSRKECMKSQNNMKPFYLLFQSIKNVFLLSAVQVILKNKFQKLSWILRVNLYLLQKGFQSNKLGSMKLTK